MRLTQGAQEALQALQADQRRGLGSTLTRDILVFERPKGLASAASCSTLELAAFWGSNENVGDRGTDPMKRRDLEEALNGDGAV